jgi:rhodanese-related sulfurtransferase
MDQMPPQVDLDELNTALKAGHPLLDVRELDEFSAVRVPQAQLVPLMSVPDQLECIRELAGAGPLYVICASGGRSNRAAAFLRGHGIEAVNVMGGTNAWYQLGNPVDTSAVDTNQVPGDHQP